MYCLFLDIMSIIYIVKEGIKVHKQYKCYPRNQEWVFFYEVKHIRCDFVSLLFCQTCFKFLSQVIDVHVYANEYDFLHPVAIDRVPLLFQSLVASEDGFEFLFWHGGIPLSCLMQ